MPRKVFISKDVGELGKLPEILLNRGYEVLAKSMLTFSGVDFDLSADHEITFFGSPRAVLFFKFKYDLKRARIIACSGRKTQELLESLGAEVSYVADHTDGIDDAASLFANWVNKRKVFFPSSNKSLMTFSKHLESGTFERATCYITEITSVKIDDCEIYVFTSPSNVEGFFESNELSEPSTVYSWGGSTSKALLDHKVQNYQELTDPSLDVLPELLT